MSQDERKQTVAVAIPATACKLVFQWVKTGVVTCGEFEELCPLIDARCGCERCGGHRGGVPGNEQLVSCVYRNIDFDILMCDACHADYLRDLP
jgi:hypothetical protein